MAAWGSSQTEILGEVMQLKLFLVTATLLAALPLGAAIAKDPAQRNPPASPPAECEAPVRYDRDRVMPGYILATSAGPRTCIPFSSVAAYPPSGYKGDFYVDEFSDVRLRERWAACKADEKCAKRVLKPVMKRRPPNREFHNRKEHDRHLLGKVNETGGDIDLSTIRRPAYFGQAPYHESFAALDQLTHIVEFTAPRDTFERIHMQMYDQVKIRGWYVRGDGLDDGKGGKTRALIVMTAGGGGRIAAITHPDDELYRIKEDGDTEINDFPNRTSGATGQELWRETAAIFNRAGFDVLLYDRRGVGISSGYSDTNTLQQGRDLLAIIASLRTGEGMRSLSPSGAITSGKAAAAAVRGGATEAGLPVLLFGNSRGTMASGWAMTMNFDKDCSYDMPEITCRPAIGDMSIKGAMLLAEFTSGPGYVMDKPSEEDEERGLGKDRGLFIAGNEIENNLVFFPSSAILGGMHKWPAAFFARGLWDYAASLQGTMDSYNRIKGLKELVVVRGPHPYETWPAVEQKRVQERLVAFARGAIEGRSSIAGGRSWSTMKELVATTSDVWERSTKPVQAP